MRIKDQELRNVMGGSDVASTIIKYISDAITKVFDIGQRLGGAIRRIATNNVCPL